MVNSFILDSVFSTTYLSAKLFNSLGEEIVYIHFTLFGGDIFSSKTTLHLSDTATISSS